MIDRKVNAAIDFRSMAPSSTVAACAVKGGGAVVEDGGESGRGAVQSKQQPESEMTILCRYCGYCRIPGQPKARADLRLLACKRRLGRCINGRTRL